MKKNSCINSWVKNYFMLHFSTPGLFMGGMLVTSTHDVTVRTPRSPCSKSWARMNASAATPTLSGHLLIAGVRMLLIVVRCCSTCLAKGTSQIKEQANRYTMAKVMALVLDQMATWS